jgi:hypothetical protein
LVITHYLTSGTGFLLVAICLVWAPQALLGHYFSPELLAIAHLAIFGWITMLIFGALYQLLPVISGNDLFSEKLSYGTYGLLLAGIACLIVSFWQFSLSGLMHIGATLILLAVSGFTFNLFKTLGNQESSIEKDFIGTSGVWLLANVILGFVLALNLRYTFLPNEHLVYLKLHAHIGAAGWFLSLIMGVGSRLLPMFALSHGVNQRPLRIAYWLLQTGLLVMLVQMLVDFPLVFFIGGAGLVGAIISYLRFVQLAYQKRMRRKLDIAMKVTFWAFVAIGLPVLIGTCLALWRNGSLGPEWGTLYGVSFFLGFIGLLIIGQTFKTFPFITWMAYLQPFVKKAQPSMPQQLVNVRLLTATVLAYALGIIGLLAAIYSQSALGVQLSSCLLAIGVFFYNTGLYTILGKTLKAHKALQYETKNLYRTGSGASTSPTEGPE